MRRRNFFKSLAVTTGVLMFSPVNLIPVETNYLDLSILDELIEQQRHYNRLISLMDYIIAVNAKRIN